MIKNGVPYCDHCKKELVALTEQECLDDIDSHGWTNWRDAQIHSCYNCYDHLWSPPCDICETQPCVKGECWANPPLHLFPYETYFANRLEEKQYVWNVDDTDFEEPLDLEIKRQQTMRLAGKHPHQKQLCV